MRSLEGLKITVSVCLAIVLICGHQIWLPSAAGQTVINSSDSNPSTVIGAGDLLDVSVLGVPELAQRVRVQNDGTISLPLLGDVSVQGQTVRGIELALANRLATGSFLVNPQVSVFVEQSTSSRIKVFGEVNSPGLYPLNGNATIADAIALAGGPNIKASHTVVVEHNDGSKESLDVRITSTSHVPLRNGDTVTIRRSPIVYAMGEVQRPGGFVVQDDTQVATVLETLALSGGPTRLAKLSDARIIHRNDRGMSQERLPMDALLKGKVADFQITDGDILFIPLSRVKEISERAVEAAFSAGTGFLVYR